jgi:hypothetical protein
MTNHPVIKLGKIPIRRYPFASLHDVQQDAKLSMERDLRTAPTPISGGMRKALHKELGAQNALRYRHGTNRALVEAHKTFGQFMVSCPRYFCQHTMFFEEAEMGDEIRCDRCKREFLV